MCVCSLLWNTEVGHESTGNKFNRQIIIAIIMNTCRTPRWLEMSPELFPMAINTILRQCYNNTETMATNAILRQCYNTILGQCYNTTETMATNTILSVITQYRDSVITQY